MKALGPAELPECFRLHNGFELPTFPRVPGIEWEQPTIKLFGVEQRIPRLTHWYGEAAYTYSGARNAPELMPTWLHGIRESVQALTGAQFNSALLNCYRDGSDSVAWHADDEPELGESPTIASLTIGAARTFSIKRRSDGQRWNVELGQGSLLVMAGESQRDYLHCVPKTSKPIGPRINITFRWID